MPDAPTPLEETTTAPTTEDTSNHPRCPYCKYAVDTLKHPIKWVICEVEVSNVLPPAKMLVMYCGNKKCRMVLPSMFIGYQQKEVADEEVKQGEVVPPPPQQNLVHTGADLARDVATMHLLNRGGVGGHRPIRGLIPRGYLQRKPS